MNRWKKAALLLVGHGSARGNEGSHATARLAELIRKRRLFAEVRSCLWKETPYPSLDLVSAASVYVVPHFAGHGLFTRKLIPQKLGLSSETRLTDRNGRRILYTDPVGSHPRVPVLLKRRALDLCAKAKIDPATAAILVIGHGSRHSGVASETPEAVAVALRSSGRFAEIATAYLEQAPRLRDWPSRVQAKNVIAAPLLISDGMHAGWDIPPLLGMTAPEGGPVSFQGHTIWLTSGIGADSEVAEMILDQIRQAESEIEDKAGPLLPSGGAAGMPDI